MNTFLIILLAVAGALLLLAFFLHVVGRFGEAGRRAAAAACRAPALDLIVAYFTFVPWIPAAAAGGWPGVLAAILGQAVALTAWIFVHEMLHPGARKGPRIVKFLNRTVGRWRNHAALWVTVVALPLFWLIRLAEVALYPLLVRLLGFPRYDQGEWVNVSRQKFSGLVGHDLIWCLYCDWMTGVYSLGAEMLRNVESFWCPIRFYDGKKCENCRTDFPDVDRGWAPPDGTMADVEAVMQKHYGGGRREWFNHPARLTPVTISAAPPSPPASAAAAAADDAPGDDADAAPPT